MSCGVGRRHGLDPLLLRLWCRLATIAPMRPLTWELPYAALKRQKFFFFNLKKKKKKERKHFQRTVKEGMNFFIFLQLNLWHTEVPRLVVELELQLLAYSIATTTPDPSCI